MTLDRQGEASANTHQGQGGQHDQEWVRGNTVPKIVQRDDRARDQ